MDLSFENNKSGNGGYITLKNSAEDVGRLTYTIVPELKKLIVSYVMVFPKFEGQGLGKKLVEKSVDFARKNGWKIKRPTVRLQTGKKYCVRLPIISTEAF